MIVRGLPRVTALMTACCSRDGAGAAGAAGAIGASSSDGIFPSRSNFNTLTRAVLISLSRGDARSEK
jgi:hypothetical protein